MSAFKHKRGIIPLIAIILVLIVSGLIAFAITRNYKKPASASQLPTNPIGDIHVDKTTGPNNGSFKFTATGVIGSSGAQIDNVRYYLLNPTLAPGNNWGDPSWCSSGTPCNQQTTGGFITYDLSQSSNANNYFEINWDSKTLSSGSTQYSRALSPTNIPAGVYTVGIRVEDVTGHVNGGASTLKITITDGLHPNASCTFSPSAVFIGEKVTINAIGTSGPIVLWAGPLTSTSFNVGNLASEGSVQVTIPTNVPFILPTSAPNPPAATNGYFKVGNTTCSGILMIKSLTGACNFDVNRDNIVDQLDVNAAASHFGPALPIGSSPYDVNRNGYVNSTDLQQISIHKGQSCSV